MSQPDRKPETCRIDGCAALASDVLEVRAGDFEGRMSVCPDHRQATVREIIGTKQLDGSWTYQARMTTP